MNRQLIPDNHISVCICTYKRPHLLARLLRELKNQKTDGIFTYSIFVVDNDHNQSAKETVSSFKKGSSVDIHYDVEPEQNIALARNRAVRNARGNFIAFIDDDEFPVNDWLLNLFKTCIEFGADGALGPVRPHFSKEPPLWIIKSGIYERESHPTGYMIQNHKYTRTGNVLLSKAIFNDKSNMFNPAFGKTGGEDVDFFKRMLVKGFSFVGCNEAPVFETVPKERWSKHYHRRRALLRGSVSFSQAIGRQKFIMASRSLLAIIIYTAALPLCRIYGEHTYMKYLIKLCDHIGVLTAACGFKIINERNQ